MQHVTVFSLQAEGLVTASERDDAARWLCELAGCACGCDYPWDTLCLAVALLDQLLSCTRVPSKYLRCAALAAFYLAAKLCEEPEVFLCEQH